MPRTSEPCLLLLDTHVWIWFMLANAELGVSRRQAINRAAASGQLRVAAISVWKVHFWRRAVALLWADHWRSG